MAGRLPENPRQQDPSVQQVSFIRQQDIQSLALGEEVDAFAMTSSRYSFSEGGDIMLCCTRRGVVDIATTAKFGGCC